MQLAPHLHRIGNDIVAAYLVEAPDGITVIDAGLPGHWRDLQAELTAMGRSLDDIKGVVLTHGDSDHLGFAERLRADHGVPVYVHAADADRAKGGDKPKVAMGPMRLGATAGFFAYALRKGGMRTRYLSEVVEVADGDVLPLPGAPVVIGMPGHSPGSIAVHVPFVRRGVRRRRADDAPRADRPHGHAARAVHRRARARPRLARSARRRGCRLGASRTRHAVARHARRRRRGRARAA